MYLRHSQTVLLGDDLFAYLRSWALTCSGVYNENLMRKTKALSPRAQTRRKLTQYDLVSNKQIGQSQSIILRLRERTVDCNWLILNRKKLINHNRSFLSRLIDQFLTA